MWSLAGGIALGAVESGWGWSLAGGREVVCRSEGGGASSGGRGSHSMAVLPA